MPGRTHSRELKLAVCQQIESGQKRPAQICREHQLAQTLLLRWRNEYKERGENAFLPKSSAVPSETEALEARIAELERHCGQLSAQLPHQGFTVNHKRVLRVMRHESLLCVLKKRFIATTNSDHDGRVYSNHLKALTLSGINQAWVRESV